MVRGECYGPVAVRTTLGYVLSGPVNVASPNQSHSSVNVFHVMKTEYRSLEGDCIQLMAALTLANLTTADALFNWTDSQIVW